VTGAAHRFASHANPRKGCQWLCGLEAISHRTLTGFRSDFKAGLDDLFVQVLGMRSAEGLITMERVTLDGTKIKAKTPSAASRRSKLIWLWHASRCGS
jgi:transposase